jgi:preprotein translocase subunit SecE
MLSARLQRFNKSRIGLLMFTKAKNFFSEVKVELQKASWPWDPKEKGFRRYKELTDSTLVVVIAMLLLGGYVALFDFVLVNFVHFFTRLH